MLLCGHNHHLGRKAELAVNIYQSWNRILFSFTKVDQSTGIGLPGAVFELRTGDGQAAVAESDACGKVQFEVQPCSTYHLTELSAPFNYARNERVFNVQVDQDGCVFFDYEPVVCPIVISNVPSGVRGTLVVTNYDTATGLRIPNAVFVLSLNGRAVQTLSAGLDGSVMFSQLSPGTYQLSQSVPSTGYGVNSSVWTVVVDNVGNVTVNSTPYYNFPVFNTRL